MALVIAVGAFSALAGCFENVIPQAPLIVLVTGASWARSLPTPLKSLACFTVKAHV